jgi:hypothetical protein
MKLYADTPGRRTRQLVADLLVAAWTAGWVWLALTVHDLVSRLAAPGRGLETAGENLEGSLREAGDRAGGVPLVGDRLREALERASASGEALADAGRAEQEAVASLALLLAVALALVPVTFVLVTWLFFRVRWVREATAARRLLRAGAAPVLEGAGAAQDLLALRALARQPMRRLVKVDPDPAEAWRRGDAEVVDALATLELRGLGLRA